MIRSTHRATRPPTVLALLAACAMSVTVAILAIWLNADGGVTGEDTPTSSTIRVGQGVTTGFGAMAVERVERYALPGPGRGQKLDVTVALINLGATVVPVASAGVGLRGADGMLRPGSVSAASPASVAPRNAVRATYSFTLSAASPALQVELTDESMTRPAIVKLGASADIPILKELDAPPHAH